MTLAPVSCQVSAHARLVPRVDRGTVRISPASSLTVHADELQQPGHDLDGRVHEH